MKFEDIFNWGTEYFSEYFSNFIFTLRSPALRFQPVHSNVATSGVVLSTETKSSTGPQINPKLFIFMMISILIGATINSVIPGRTDAPDLLTTAVVTLSVWIAYSISVYLACIVLKGSGSFLETVSVSLQVLAVVYVFSNFITFVWSMIAEVIFTITSVQGFFIEQPIYIYYVVQFSLMAFYLPVALRHVQKFGVGRQMLLIIIPLVWVFVGLAIYLVSNIMLLPNFNSTQPGMLLPTQTVP